MNIYYDNVSEVYIDPYLWNELVPLIPKDKAKNEEKNNIDNLEFIKYILFGLSKKTRLSNQINWKNAGKKQIQYSNRFGRWRKNGIWENLLPIFIKHKDFYWLGNPYIYEILLKDYKLLTLLNESYLYNSPDVELTPDEVQQKLYKKFPRYMHNRKRRTGKRGTYDVYCEEEKEYFMEELREENHED